jgi:DNA replication protein DnaC
MIAQPTKNCPSCGKSFETSDKRKVYCSNGCKQDAFRTRHGVTVPAFLQPKGKVNSVQKTRVISKRVVNPQHKELGEEIKRLEGQLVGYVLHRQSIANDEARILSQNDELLAGVATGALAAGVLISVTVLGAGLSTMVKDKNSKERIMLIALLVALAAAGLTAAISHSGIKDKHQQRKLRKLQNLKQEAEQIDIMTLGTTSELAALKAQQMTLPEHINESEEVDYQEQELDASERLATLDELQNQRFETISLSSRFTDLFGEPAKGFMMAVHGGPGQGKSTFTVDLAKDLANHNNQVLFVAAEEGYSKSLQQKFVGYRSDQLRLSNSRNLTSVKDSLKRSHYDVIVLDSVQQMGIKPQQLTALKTAYPKTGIVYILHATKGGTFKGDNRYAHDADIIVKLDEYKPVTEKSRYK